MRVQISPRAQTVMLPADIQAIMTNQGRSKWIASNGQEVVVVRDHEQRVATILLASELGPECSG